MTAMYTRTLLSAVSRHKNLSLLFVYAFTLTLDYQTNAEMIMEIKEIIFSIVNPNDCRILK